MRFALWPLLVLCCLGARAEVYDLLRGGGGWEQWEKSLGSKKLWTEPVDVNGVRGALSVSILDLGMAEALRVSRRELPGVPAMVNANSALFERKEGKLLRRVYLVGFPGKDRTMRFAMDIPLDAFRSRFWPEPLPSLPDMTPKESLCLPERQLYFGSCVVSSSPAAATAELSRVLGAQGWRPLSDGVFVSADAKRTVLFSAAADGKGSTTVSLVRKNLDK